MTEIFCKSIKLDTEPKFYKDSVSRIISKVSEEEAVEINAALSENKWLYFGTAILASSSLNRNGELFLPEEMWEARYTPIDTPFNIGHKKKDIVGHITGVRFLDAEGTEISAEQEKAPDYFDIETEFVIYAHIFPDVIKEIEENAEEGKVMVSLEARAPDYDFALFENEEDYSIVRRNKETEFLSKHLASKKGSGTYKGKKLARVPRNFTFSGMGHVDVGANPKSYYTSLGKKNVEILNNLKDVNKLFCINTVEDNSYNIAAGKNIMAKHETLEAAEAEIQTLKAELAEAKKSQTEDINASLQNKIDIYDAKVTELAASLEGKSKEVIDLEAKLTEANEKLEKVSGELNEIHAANLGEKRVAELEAKGASFGDKRDEKVRIYAVLTEDQFKESLVLADSLPKPKTDDKEKEVTADEIKASLETEKVDEVQIDAVAKDPSKSKIQGILSKVLIKN